MSSTTPGSPLTDFGANEWLVNEMYERYRENPDSVSAGWREFFGGQPVSAPDADEAESEAPAEEPPVETAKTEAEVIGKGKPAPATVKPEKPTVVPKTVDPSPRPQARDLEEGGTDGD
ncbi:hypothetical protein GCM10029992_63720 [Glycomyces albus]